MSTSTTTVGGGTITLTDEELGPYVTHAGTRQWLTGPGLPHESALLGFGALRERAGLRRMAELVADAGKLAQELRDQLVIGSLRTLERDLESIVLDGTTGAVSTTSLHRDPGLMDLSPLAPSLESLLRFAGATEELVASRGLFTAYEGRFGPKSVAEASARLASVFAADSASGTAEDVAPYWRMAALIRPSPASRARVTGSRSTSLAACWTRSSARARSCASRRSTSPPRSRTSRRAASWGRSASPRTASSESFRGYPRLQPGEEANPCGAGQRKTNRRQGDSSSTTNRPQRITS